jgi:hypothetical protein
MRGYGIQKVEKIEDGFSVWMKDSKTRMLVSVEKLMCLMVA